MRCEGTLPTGTQHLRRNSRHFEAANLSADLARFQILPRLFCEFLDEAEIHNRILNVKVMQI